MKNELYHHGILGQKWGVRRYQNKDGTWTPEGKEHIAKISRKYADRYSDFTMKKGSSFNRVGSDNERDEGRTYVSFKKDDEKRYLSYYDTLGATTKMKLSAVSDIKIAGGKAQIDTFLEMYGEHKPEDFAEHVGNATRYQRKEFKEKTKLYKNALNDEESFNKAFEDFSASLMARCSISDEFIGRMSKKGYSAIVDINDRDAADMPLYVFDRKASLKTTSRSEITAKDVDDAMEWVHRTMKHSDTPSDELYHHGILGMKWGVRRYQNPDGSLTDAGRKRYGSLIRSVFTSYRKKRRLAKALKKRQATLDAKKEAVEKARAHEEEKRKAIESGDPVRISAFQNELSNEELRAATDRVRLTATLKAQKEDTIQTGLDKAESIMGKVTKVKNLAEQGIGAWNTAAKIHNSFTDDDDEKWPVIDGTGKKDDRKAIKKVIETGDPEQIAKLKGKLTVGETTDAIKSINNWKNIEANAAQNASNRAEAASKAEDAKKAAEKAQTDKFERYYQQKAKSDASRDADIERERMDRAFDEGKKYYEKFTSSSNKSTESDSPYFTYEDSSRAQKLLSSFGGQLLLEDKKRK